MSASGPGSRRSLVAGTLNLFAAEALVFPVGFVTMVFLARRLEPDGYGLFVITMSLVSWLQWSLASFFEKAGVKFVSQTDDWRPVGGSLARLHLVTGVALGAAVWLLADPASRFFDVPSLADCLRLVAADLPLFSLSYAYLVVLVGLGRFKTRARLVAVYWSARLLLVVLFVEAGLSVSGAILGTVGASLVQLGAGMTAVRIPLWGRSTLSIGRLWSVAAPLFASSVVIRLVKLDLLVLKALGAGVAQVGCYGVAQGLFAPSRVFSGSLSRTLLSTLSRLLAEDRRQHAGEIASAAVRFVIVLLPFFGIIAGSSAEIVELVFGAGFLPAAPIVSILAFAVFSRLLMVVSEAVLTAVGRPDLIFKVVLPCLPIAVVGHLIATARFQGVGAASVTTAVFFFGAVSLAVAVRRVWNVGFPTHSLIVSVLCTAPALLVCGHWSTPGWPVVAKTILISGCVVAVYFVTGEVRRKDLEELGSLVPVPGGRYRNPGD
jgi:O-antigen/teichoic acid export membrane protein